MSDEDVLDIELPPVDLPTPEDFVVQEGSVEPVENVDAGIDTDLGWEFCLRFNGKPWQNMTFQAESAAEAAGWATAFTRLVNNVLVERGFPPAATWSPGLYY